MTRGKGVLLFALAVLLLSMACAAPPAQAPAAPAQEEVSATQAPTEEMAAEGPEIVIGLQAPLTGPNAEFGEAMRNGAELAVTHVNEAGGVDGRSVRLVVGDDKSQPADGVAVVQRFVTEEGMSGVLGGFNSSVNLATQEVTGDAGIVHLNMGASPRLAQDETGNPLLFRAILTDKVFVPHMVDYIVGDQGFQRIAIIAENTDYGLAELETFRDNATAAGAEIVTEETYNPGDTEFSAQLAKIQEADPDALMIGGLVTEAALIAKQAQAAGLGDVQLFSPSDGVDTPQLITLGGDAVDGYIFASMIDLTRDDPVVVDFRQLAEAEGIDVQAYVAITYDAANVLFNAFSEVGTEGTAVADWLKNNSVVGVTGPIQFDEVGDRTSPPFIRQVQGGEFVTVKAPSE